jgi:flagellar basal body-associated protein FliL
MGGRDGGDGRRFRLAPRIALCLSPATKTGAGGRLDKGVTVAAIVWILIVVAILVIVAAVVLIMRARSRGRMIVSRRESSRRTGGQP